MTIKRVILFLLIVGPISALLAWGLTRDPNVLPSTMIGKPAPDFALRTLDGKELTRAALSGTPTVINFWATWCTPCLQEHATFRRARERYASAGVRFVGVVYQDKEAAVRDFLAEYGQPFDIVWDPASTMAIDYGVGGVPETFFIDAHGVIRAKYAGPMTMRDLQERLDPIVVGE